VIRTLCIVCIQTHRIVSICYLTSYLTKCKNPNKDLTIGIIVSLILSTAIYVCIAALVTLIAPYETLNNAQPLAHALNLNGSTVGSAIVATGAVCGMTTVILTQSYALSRIFYVMARDGLVSKHFAKIHPKYGRK
jgi:APA family basic amino acid/polyamine antiporter